MTDKSARHHRYTQARARVIHIEGQFVSFGRVLRWLREGSGSTEALTQRIEQEVARLEQERQQLNAQRDALQRKKTLTPPAGST